MKSIIEYIVENMNEYIENYGKNSAILEITNDPVHNIPVITFISHDYIYNATMFISGDVHFENCIINNIDLIVDTGYKCIFDKFLSVSGLNMHSVVCNKLPETMIINDGNLILSPYEIPTFPKLLVAHSIMYDKLDLDGILSISQPDSLNKDTIII